jgi:hypothetical protein
MEYATLNGVPIITYGLIGATTALLAYSVFRDESKSTDASSGFKMPSVSLPAVAMPTVSLPSVSMPAVAMPAVAMPTLSLPSVSLPAVAMPTLSLPSVSMPGVPSTSPELKSPSIPPTRGGKRKRTRRKRGSITKQTKQNRK